MRTTFDRVSAMSAEQRDALMDRFEKASRIAAAEPVAVVGIGCRFPGGALGPDAYWKLLTDGVDAIGEVPADRWDADAYYDPDPSAPGRMASKWGAFLSDVAGFDADFFGISPREAEAMDPQQRVLLEVAWEALEHSGVAPDQVGGIRAAVMITRSTRVFRRRTLTPSTPTPQRVTRTASRWAGSHICWGCAVPPSRSTRHAPRRWCRCTWPARACECGRAISPSPGEST